MILLNIYRAIFIQKEMFLNEIRVICLFNYIILKIVVLSSTPKGQKDSKSTAWLHFISKNPNNSVCYMVIFSFQSISITIV